MNVTGNKLGSLRSLCSKWDFYGNFFNIGLCFLGYTKKIKYLPRILWSVANKSEWHEGWLGAEPFILLGRACSCPPGGIAPPCKSQLRLSSITKCLENHLKILVTKLYRELCKSRLLEAPLESSGVLPCRESLRLASSFHGQFLHHY